MRRNRISMLLLLMLAVVFCSFAEEQLISALTWLNEQDRSALLEKRELRYIADRYDQLPIWKNSPYNANVAKLFDGKPSTIAAEGLFLIDIPENALMLGPDFLMYCITAVSTLKGLQFFYEPTKTTYPFIIDAYRVGKTDKNARLPDPPYTGAPERGSFIMYQREANTGDGFSIFEFIRKPEGIEINQMNLTPLNLGILQLIGPRDMLTHIRITQVGKQLLFYSIVEANTIQFFGLEKTKAYSLYNRMKAIAAWFSGNLYILSAERS